MKGFSAGIFFIIIIVILLLSACLSGGYFYMDVKRLFEETADYTWRYSLPLADAVSEIALNCYRKNDYRGLKRLLESGIFKKNIEEAFFVLADGAIIAHSDVKAFERLKGNISNDKQAYNSEQIFFPLKSKSAEAQIFDYNIHGKKIPFEKDNIRIFSKYINNKFNFSGWLVSKAVAPDDKGIGCVCFFIGKDRLYRNIGNIFHEAVYLAVVFFCTSLLIAFMVAILIHIRYRNVMAGRISGEVLSFNGGRAVKDAVRIAGPPDEREQVAISSWEMTVPDAETRDEPDSNINSVKIIKDAIPLSGE